jgi:DNA-binding NarL/FixJ family response regulator
MIRILIADDHPILRRGLKGLLVREIEGAICGEAGNVQQVISEVQSQDWDLVILDMMMPGRSGLDALPDIKRLRPRLPVLMLSLQSEDQLGVRALKAGASGYMNKESVPEELIKAIRRVLAGGVYVSAALAERMVMDWHQDAARPVHEALSGRELEVLRLMGQGKTVSQIAGMLHLSVRTVSTYRARILEKMGLTTTAELINYAVRTRLVD